eukprot:3756650-Rhodomonas_salina.7
MRCPVVTYVLGAVRVFNETFRSATSSPDVLYPSINLARSPDLSPAVAYASLLSADLSGDVRCTPCPVLTSRMLLPATTCLPLQISRAVRKSSRRYRGLCDAQY